MLTADVTQWGLPPKATETPGLPPLPQQGSGMVQVRVLATAVHSIVRLRASGKHYSASTLPHRPGTDGVGIIVSSSTTEAIKHNSGGNGINQRLQTDDNGGLDQQDHKQLVYFSALRAGGSFAERINVPLKDVIPLPSGTDPTQAAAVINPALSSWMAVRKRCSLPSSSGLPSRGLKVLVLGATTLSGRVAIPLLRHLGFSTIIGCARRRSNIGNLGFDECIGFAEEESEPTGGDRAPQFGNLENVDVVLDYLCGLPALQLLQALPKGQKTTFIMIGNMAGKELPLPATLLRSKDVTIVGSGIGSWSNDEMQEELIELAELLPKIPEQQVKVCHLKEVETTWGEVGQRLVFVP